MDGVNIANLGKNTIRRKHILSTPVERAHTNAPVRKQKATPKNAAQTDLHTVRSRLVMVPQAPVLFQVSHILFDSKPCVGSYGSVFVIPSRRVVSDSAQLFVCYQGTLRYNLDPYEEFTDKELWKVRPISTGCGWMKLSSSANTHLACTANVTPLSITTGAQRAGVVQVQDGLARALCRAPAAEPRDRGRG